MAFTLTKMRDTIITHVNKQSDKIQMFKEDSINKLVTYDCLKVCIFIGAPRTVMALSVTIRAEVYKTFKDFMGPGHWLNCSYDNYDHILKAALSAGDTTVKRRIIAELLKRNKKYVEFSKRASKVNMDDLMLDDALN